MKYTLLLLSILIPCFAFALNAEERLVDNTAELRAHEVFKQIRCVVCAGESINDSKADIAKSLRVLVRDRIKAGDSDAQVLTYITERYGDSILMKPPFDGDTYILWLAPFIMLILGGGLVFIFFKKRA
jgi:cytochrome c-type biogenesis protein CcmH